MSPIAQAALWTALWCAAHSLFVTHWWRGVVRRAFPRWHVFDRLVYVLASTVSLAALCLWLWTLPARLLWDWPGWWAWVRWLGLAEALLLFWLGGRTHDSRHFLGLRQAVAYLAGRPAAAPRFREDGILGVIRHPWYAGALVFLVFCLPWTDVNLAWRGVFIVYTLIGCELEERKLLSELGEDYAAYRRRVGRYLPQRRRSSNISS